MKHFSQLAALMGFLLANTMPVTSQGAQIPMQSKLSSPDRIAALQKRWLDEFGPSLRVEPLCNSSLASVQQALLPSTCSALSHFQNKRVPFEARLVRIRELKRDRAFWSTIARRDQRILEQYEVIGVGEANAVAAKTGAPR